MWKHFRKVQQKDEIIKFLKRFILFLGVCVFLCMVMCTKVKMTKEEKREYQNPESKVTGGFKSPTWVFNRILILCKAVNTRNC